MNRKEREKLERKRKVRRLLEGLCTLLLNVCFFSFIIVIVLGFMYFGI